MEIQHNIGGDSYELLVSGRIDEEGAKRLDEAILAILLNKNKDIEQEPKTICINLNRATSIGGVGLRTLLEHWRRMKKGGGQLLVTHPSPEVTAALQMAGVYDKWVEKT